MNIRNTIYTASRATLSKPVQVSGVNPYELATDLFKNGRTSAVCPISDLSETFGQRSGDLFRCGTDMISYFDFGLLYTVFESIADAYAESSSMVQCEESESGDKVIQALWFNDILVVYSVKYLLILPISADAVASLSRHKKLSIKNFAGVDTYTVGRVGNHLCIDSPDGVSIVQVEFSAFAKVANKTLFDDDPTNDEVRDDPYTAWDERSELGSLIGKVSGRTSIDDAIQSYRSSCRQTDVKSELVFPLSESTAVTVGQSYVVGDSRVGVLLKKRPVCNTYADWLTKELFTDTQAHLSDVTDACTRIYQFARTVTARPTPCTKFNSDVFAVIKKRFYSNSLHRLSLSESFGKNVIPESALIRSLYDDNWCLLQCVVPLGVVGTTMVCYSDSGDLQLVEQGEFLWNGDGMFYDVGGVIDDVC